MQARSFERSEVGSITSEKVFLTGTRNTRRPYQACGGPPRPPCTLGGEIIEFVIRQSGGEVVVLDQDVGSAEDELSKDLLHILPVFSCRRYGRRQYHHARQVVEDSSLSPYGAAELVAALVRCLQKDLQRDGGIPLSTLSRSG